MMSTHLHNYHLITYINLITLETDYDSPLGEEKDSSCRCIVERTYNESVLVSLVLVRGIAVAVVNKPALQQCNTNEINNKGVRKIYNTCVQVHISLFVYNYHDESTNYH